MKIISLALSYLGIFKIITFLDSNVLQSHFTGTYSFRITSSTNQKVAMVYIFNFASAASSYFEIFGDFMFLVILNP